jgi:bifunctional non-homologous end joining protein LigD
MVLRSCRPDGAVEPCLPRLAQRPPAGPGWIHEIKHDGFRIMARRDAAGARLFTRKGNDFTKRFPTIAAAIEALSARSCFVDGEVIVCDENGLVVFDLIRRRRSSHADAILCAFDLLELDGDDMRKLPIERRKIVLAKLLGRVPPWHRFERSLRGRRRRCVQACMRSRL